MNRSRSRTAAASPLKTILALVVAVLLVASGVTYYYAGKEPGPLVAILQPFAIGSSDVTVEFTVDAVGSKLVKADAVLEQQGRSFPLFALASPGQATFTQETPTRVRITRVVPATALTGLKDGAARVTVTAVRKVLFGLRQAASVTTDDVRVRTTPPSLVVLSTHHYIKLGGAEVVVYKVTPPEAESGVEVGDRIYPGFPAAGANPARKDIDPSIHVAFFGLLFDQDATTPIRVTAKDEAGNRTILGLEHKVLAASFERRRVPIDDAFLERVVPGILSATPELKLRTGTPEERLQAFLTINGELRRTNEGQIESIARKSAPELLWKGAFQRMGRAKSEAVFADHRTYVYRGKDVDQQVHLGADLASVRGAVIPAANAGHVLFAGFLGIYGNCVILDHGMGVQSLYAHLSSADVEAGDRLDRGEAIGHSGATGLAGGDHLHFSMLVAGRPVNPVEWWDLHWITDRIQRKFAEAGLVAGGELSAQASPDVTPAPKARPRTGARKPAAPKKRR
jgi:hypothetical protein